MINIACSQHFKYILRTRVGFGIRDPQKELLKQSDLAFLSANDEVITWLRNEEEDNSVFSIVSLPVNSDTLHLRKPQIFLKTEARNNLGGGDFENRSSILTEIRSLQALLPGLQRDTAERIVIDRLVSDDPSSRELIYHETATTIRVNFNGLWHSITREQFDTNLTRSTSVLPNTDKARIMNAALSHDILERATFIFNAVRGVKTWNTVDGATVNPYALFNRELK